MVIGGFARSSQTPQLFPARQDVCLATGTASSRIDGQRRGVVLLVLLGVLALFGATAFAYVAVASQLVRLEERLNAIRQEMQLRQSYTERDISGLMEVDERLAAELAQLRGKTREGAPCVG